MEENKKVQNWRNYSSMQMLYEQAQKAAGGLEPDWDFLSDPHLGRYQKYQLKELALPETICNFLNQVGLPDRFYDWRSPDEERECKEREGYFGVVFPMKGLRLETIGRRKFLVIGEERSLDRSSIICDGTWSWWKSEECSYIIVELKTGKVWSWSRSFDEDFLTYVNSSLEQYLLSMAYWRSFYPILSEKVEQFLETHPEKTELDYLFRNRKTLYAPFRERLEALDTDALKKRQSYWKMMCDLSVY